MLFPGTLILASMIKAVSATLSRKYKTGNRQCSINRGLAKELTRGAGVWDSSKSWLWRSHHTPECLRGVLAPPFPIQLPVLMLMTSRIIGFLPPTWETWTGFLALAWPSSNCHEHVGSEPVGCKISLSLSALKINNRCLKTQWRILMNKYMC